MVTVRVAVDGWLSVLRIYRQDRQECSRPFASIRSIFAPAGNYPARTSVQANIALQSARTPTANGSESEGAIVQTGKRSVFGSVALKRGRDVGFDCVARMEDQAVAHRESLALGQFMRAVD